MRKFLAKILVRAKPTAQDVKCLTLKLAIEKLVPIRNLNCHTGTFYVLNFNAPDQREALHMVEKVAGDLLSNEFVEEYEITALEEVYNELD
jgi:phosphoribosylformylglycinamidine (FGAM) synthase PurS component